VKYDNQDICERLTQLLPRLYPLQGVWDVSLLSCSENLIFIVSQGEEKRIVRVNRKGYHTKSEIEAELRWMATLNRDVAIHLPQVFIGKNGNYVQELGDVNLSTCCMFSFLQGVPLHSLQGEALLEALEKVGSLTARLHRHSMQDRTEYERFCWDWDSLFGSTARWGSWKDYRFLEPSDIPVIEQVLEILHEKFVAFGYDRSVYGLIHSDLHVSNVLLAFDRSLQIIDFDDCGYGWYLYDIACILVTYCEDLERTTESVLKGYEQVRPLSKKEKDMLPSCILLRRLARFAWLASHSESDTAKKVNNSLYREITMILCNEILNGSYE
jgi:Ser/Thr protein kinase RdoA (MazF antagonist)